MAWRLGGILGVSGVLTALAWTAEPASRVTVFTYNYAALPSGVLSETPAEVGRIFHSAGIEILWLECPWSPAQPGCLVRPGQAWLVLRLLPVEMASRARECGGCLGWAMRDAGKDFGIFANVNCTGAEALANRRRLPQSVILGHLITHELGHLLLGSGSHAIAGIMHNPWGRHDLELIGRGGLYFLPAEAKRMRYNVANRSRPTPETIEAMDTSALVYP